MFTAFFNQIRLYHELTKEIFSLFFLTEDLPMEEAEILSVRTDEFGHHIVYAIKEQSFTTTL